jgi:hypothetical protein
MNQSHRSAGHSWWALLFVVIALLPGCEDNPASSGGATCDHVDADGVVVETSDRTLLAHQWEGIVTGEIEVGEGETLAGLQVWFLDADSVRTRPGAACVDHALRFAIGDTALVRITAVPGQPWSFDLHGRSEGETTVRLLVEHGDHVDFTSLPLAVHVHHQETEHTEPEGVVLLSGGLEVARVFEGVVTGSLRAFTGEQTADIEVAFLAADGDEFVPDDPEVELRVEVGDEAIVTAQTGSGWAFRLTGQTVGTTTLSIVVWHDGHADFSSAPIEVETVAPVTIGALILTDGPDWVASDRLNVTGAWGPILVPLGTTREDLRVEIPVEEGREFRDTEYLRLPTGHRIEATLADGTRADLQRAQDDPQSFHITGAAVGATTIEFRVVAETTVVYTSNPIPLVVFAPRQGDPAPTFQLRLNGRTEVGVIDGQLQPVDAQVCASTVWTTGFVQRLSSPNGPLTDLIGIRVFDDACNRETLSDTAHHLAFLFSDRGIARTTHHPEHVGERLVFHVEGVTPGSTTMTLVLVQTSTSDVVFVSPPIPVTITE